MEAAVVWSAITPENQKRVLNNVFCRKCPGAIEMINFKGTMEKGNLILTGACAQCGNKVVRLIESSERDPSRN